MPRRPHHCAPRGDRLRLGVDAGDYSASGRGRPRPFLVLRYAARAADPNMAHHATDAAPGPDLVQPANRGAAAWTGDRGLVRHQYAAVWAGDHARVIPSSSLRVNRIAHPQSEFQLKVP